MDVSDRMKEFKDPLMNSFSSQTRKRNQAADDASPREGWGMFRFVALGVLVAVLAVLGYLLYQSQQQIQDLNTNLLASQEQLAGVSQRLETSQEELGKIKEGLSSSESSLLAQKREIGRYQKLYTDLKEEQTTQTRELEALSIRKADQSQIEELRETSSSISQQVGSLDSRMEQVNSNISDLREQTVKNRQDLDGTQATLSDVQGTVETNVREIADVKHSLDREYYNFELHKDGGVMRVFNVALNLKKVDFKKQRFELEILANGKTIQKKQQSINVPVYFYVEGTKKPYEVLINKVDKKFVVGYLSVPKQ